MSNQDEKEDKKLNQRDITVGSVAPAGSTAVSPLGAIVYNNDDFKAHINHLYYPASNMEKSVDLLIKARGKPFLSKMKWGEYQLILSPMANWPGNTGKHWAASVAYARAGLARVSNADPLSTDEPRNVPKDKCSLLDAAIRKCFSSTPPIPMTIDVDQQNTANANTHGLRLRWVYDTVGRPPILLELTMICPYGS